ncbi:hypothetical protein ABZY16_26855 [Streptomyces sp. NPDC006553]|uniref:hypothetical protein n=1 Tax=Streptomyces sp. NPDC006553 TaxID=3157180 RepID=UPI0033A34A48
MPDDELIAFVCERYSRADRLADAVTVRRNTLRVYPSLAAYSHLRTAARTAGAWEGAERTDALTVLKAVAQPKTGHWYSGSVLVDALIDDADFDAAWQAAEEGYADQWQWLALADRIRNQRPADALTVSLRWIDLLRKRTGDITYQRMATLLLSVSVSACHHTGRARWQHATRPPPPRAPSPSRHRARRRAHRGRRRPRRYGPGRARRGLAVPSRWLPG